MKYWSSALGILILAVVAIVLIGTRSTGDSSGSSTGTKKSKPGIVKLLDYENKDASLSVTVQGTLVGDDQRRAIRITITPEDRGVEELHGYDQAVVRSQHYKNTQSGYEEFLRAVNYSGFITKRTSNLADERGVCPFGQTYIYDLIDNNDQVSHLWGNSCSAALGTFAGNGPAIRQLFQNQITDYVNFSSTVQL